MTDNSSNPAERSLSRIALSWLLFPLALFPLVALLTYDWRCISSLHSPPMPSTNWIGALGDGFAYCGYMIFGLAIWIVPVLSVVAGLCLICGRRMRPGRRELWFFLFLVCQSCIIQVVGDHAGAVADITAKINIHNAGGAIGHLLMTRCLSPLLSDFGASVLMVLLMLVSLVAAVGAGNIAAFFAAIARWAVGDGSASKAADGGLDEDKQAAYLAAIQAKEDARRQREAEKAAAREEKQRLKEEKRRLKEELRLQREAERNAARGIPPPAPIQAQMPAARPAPAVRNPNPAAVSNEQSAAELEDKGPYILPPLSLLNPLSKSTADHSDVGEMSKRLIDTLKIFGVDATLAYTVQGPVVTKYAVQLAPGTRYNVVTNISDNLMGALHAKSLRIEAPIPGEDCIGIEVPNRSPAGISFREIIESDAWRNFKGELPLLFGKDAAGKELVADLAKMPHMLVAGATGQGKSVCLNAIINGLLMTKTPEQLKLIMVDPKSVEFTSYVSIPHLIVPIITENRKVVFALHWAVAEMEKRLKLFARAKVRNIYDFNHRLQFTQTDMFGADTEVGTDMPKTVPYIVIIIDEVADLMAAAAKDVVPDISRLTAKARAAGIHLILATQRPDAKVITDYCAELPVNVDLTAMTGSVSTITVPAGETYHFTLFGGYNRTLHVTDAGAEILFRDQTYAPDENGAIAVRIVTDSPRDHAYVALTNKSGDTREITLTLVSDPGAMDNPIVVETLGESITANVPQDGMIYYRWTATAAGKLTVTSADAINNISLNNLANSKVTDFTNGAESVTLEVAEGDTITIVVSVIGGDKQAETNPVTFTLTLGE